METGENMVGVVKRSNLKDYFMLLEPKATPFFFLSDLTSDTFLVYGSLLLIRVDKSLVFLTEYNCLEVLRRWLPSGQTILEKKNIGHFVSVQLVTVAHLHNVPPPINERGSP